MERATYRALVEARFDPRRILKERTLDVQLGESGVEARFDPRRILKGRKDTDSHSQIGS